MDIFSENITINDLGSAIRLLKESRDGFVKLFNNSPVCMSMTTTTLGKRTYVRVNRKFLEKFGYKEEEVIGKTSVEIGILDQEESDRVRSIITDKGKLQNDYVKCIAKNGDIVHTVSSIEYMEMNDTTYLVAFFVDITQIIDQQTLIEKHAKQLEAVNKELESFSYSVSHDLRAPLRAIDGYARMLEADFANLFDDEGVRLLNAVKDNTKKMSTLIDDLLEFSKLGKKPIKKTTIDMNMLVREVLSDLKMVLDSKTVVSVPELLPLNGDYALIKQVMINLISNAIKYSSQKESPLVEVFSKSEGDEVIYTVRDNGAGFNMKYANRLFNVFQRLHDPTEFEGTGVGLAIVQRIVNRHGGTVRAEGEIGKGASFSFSIPNDYY